MLRRWWWLVVLMALALIAVAAVVTVKATVRARFGTVYDDRTRTVAVDRGGRFSLAVPDRGASVGDHWTTDVRPAGTVTLARTDLVSGSLVDRFIGPANGGGGGRRYFVFDATQPGPVTITLHNCFQGCGDDRTRAESRDLTWTVTVH